MAMALDHLDKALFAKLTKFVFGLGDAVAVGDQDVAGVERNCALLVCEVIEQADDRAATVETAHAAVRTEHEGRQLTTVGVEQLARVGVVVRKKQRGVFFRLSRAVEVTVEHAEHLAG